ncbi:MAG: hypothetical protein RQ745_12680 [Longimicrobiales bacterium]|nr:hypothetical protein [Longimicrobiales bacterium]
MATTDQDRTTRETTTDRREFLRRIALTSVYAAPVIRALSAPPFLTAQQGGGIGTTSAKGGGNDGGAMGMDMNTTTNTFGSSFPAPWQ